MIRFIIIASILCFGIVSESYAQTASPKTPDIPANAAQIIRAYPEQNLNYENNAIIFPDGTALTFDDGKNKNFEQTLDAPDLEDMFRIPYQTKDLPSFQEDAGRIRNDVFFQKMYGASASEVKKKLVSISWFGQKITFTGVNHAAEQLQLVAREIEENYPELKKYMTSSGTFVWRKVRHSNRMSAHCYGIAIDIGVKYSNYWKWSVPHAKEDTIIEYKNRIPMQIVDIFEKHGFVWGGRWYHFDTMHFEYRPEIVANQARP